MSLPKVLIAGNILWTKKEFQELQSSSIATLVTPDVSSRAAFLKDLEANQDASVIVYTNGAKFGGFDRELFTKLPKSVKFICSHGAGYDSIDVEAATEHVAVLTGGWSANDAAGVSVSHTPSAVDHGTATTALYLLLGAFRQYAHGEINARKGLWLKDFPLAHDPEGKTLGIVGMGGIGKALARRVLPLGMKILYHNRREITPAPDFPCEYVANLDDLLARSDAVSLHMPLNENTRNGFGAAQFAKMKDGSVLINTARGGVVDQEALIQALDSGKLYSAGLDVFPNEPEIDQRLRDNVKISILPHVGTHTLESRYGMEMLVLKNVKTALESGTLVTQVPEQRAK
ncbi:Putative 2-hydroxyacid dehydrogenase [Saitozyma sp. JCM 24511]|nr:Putative 2-hydroxyacid dehydrogenase [Saitozyma sp. JCM 24511]